MEDTTARLTDTVRLPVVPADLMTRFHVSGIADTRFSRCARLLQAIWRDKRGFDSGIHKAPGRSARRLGNLLSPEVARTGVTFLDAEIARLARREVAYREYGALIDERRLWENLLSSQTLTFNLLGKAKLNLGFASRLFAALLPGQIAEVHQIGFEHSPGRGDPAYLGDYTALDAYALGTGPDGGPIFIGMEVKYAEAMQRPERGRLDRLRQLAQQSSIFSDPTDEALFSEPTAQLTGEHLLTELCARQLGATARGVFLVIAPENNREAATVIDRYRSMLQPENSIVPFIPVSLEDAVSSVAEAGDADLAGQLIERYVDLAPVHALIDDWEPSF